MEVVPAEAYDAACDELDAALAHISLLERRYVSRGLTRGKYGPKPEEVRVTLRERLPPLDLSKQQHPL